MTTIIAINICTLCGIAKEQLKAHDNSNQSNKRAQYLWYIKHERFIVGTIFQTQNSRYKTKKQEIQIQRKWNMISRNFKGRGGFCCCCCCCFFFFFNRMPKEANSLETLEQREQLHCEYAFEHIQFFSVSFSKRKAICHRMVLPVGLIPNDMFPYTQHHR